MVQFKRETHRVNGVDTVLYTAGTGDPLVFFHGGGTFHGYEFANTWAEKFRVIHPYHPGFAESGDDPGATEMQDYVMHYLELFEMLGLDAVNLVGFSLGGYMAAKFAMSHGDRVRKLALVAPAGLRDKAHPMTDIMAVPGEQLPGMLVSNFDVIRKWLPTGPDPDFIAARYREGTTMAKLLWERTWDPKFPRYLHRLRMPTLIMWGSEDRIVPVQQAETWRKFLPAADIRVFEGAGHLLLDEDATAVLAVANFMAK